MTEKNLEDLISPCEECIVKEVCEKSCEKAANYMFDYIFLNLKKESGKHAKGFTLKPFRPSE